jgi:RNA polymerase sigma-70 factor (ECF subfamily)
MNENDEALWLDAARRGDPAAFGRLITAYQQKVFGFTLGFLRREDAADEITQETFVRAWRGLPGFRGDSAFQTWLFQIALNAVRGRARREKIREKLFFWETAGADPVDPLERVPDPGADPARSAENADLARRLRAAVARLPPREKEVFLLRHEGDMALADIARALKVAEGTVKAHLFHALEKLRTFLETPHDL